MANVYTTLLWSATGLISGSNHSGNCPDGYVWVIRWIGLCLPGSYPYAGALGAAVVDQNGAVIFQPQNPVVQNYAYGWEGHAVIQAGYAIRCVTQEAGWTIHATGFQLTLP